jgi:hypothetical protein
MPGVELYRGPSLLDGAPIVVLAQTSGSRNSKTGPGPQVYIMRADIPPIDAVRTGADVSICGACVHRGDRQTGRGRSCYVVLTHAPRAVWDAWQRGKYPPIDRALIPARFAGKFVRLGAYGDPAAAPHWVWDAITRHAVGWTGYTHQWRLGFALQAWCMASVETDAEADDAIAMGYRVFRVTAPGVGRLPGHVVCPASAERGRVLQCDACRGCSGEGRRGHIQIAAHGHRVRNVLPVLHSGAPEPAP